MDKVSIIVPLYNSEKYIEKTIFSLINQTYSNIEILVINDGSTDRSRKICEKFKNSKVRLINIKNSGVSNARNVGIKNATGKYIMFSDSDDFYEENFVKVAVNYIKKGFDVVVFGYNKVYRKNVKKCIINKNINNLNKYEFIEILQDFSMFNNLWNKIYLTDIIKRNNVKFDVSIFRGEDYKFNLDYFNNISKYCYIPLNLYNYRVSNGGLATKYDEFELDRRINLIKYSELIYEKNNFPKAYIYYKYIEAIAGSIQQMYYHGLSEEVIKDKIKEILTSDKIISIFNEKIVIKKKEYKFYYYLLKNKYISLLLSVLKLKNYLKNYLKK